MKHRQVVVDQTAIVAALDPSAAGHADVVAEMSALVDAYDRNEVEPVTHSDAITGAVDELGRRGAPQDRRDAVHTLARVFDVEVLHADLRRDALAVMHTAREHGIDIPFASALVVEVARRRGTRRVLSLDPHLSAIDLDLLPVRPDDEPDEEGQSSPA